MPLDMNTLTPDGMRDAFNVGGAPDSVNIQAPEWPQQMPLSLSPMPLSLSPMPPLPPMPEMPQMQQMQQLQAPPAELEPLPPLEPQGPSAIIEIRRRRPPPSIFYIEQPPSLLSEEHELTPSVECMSGSEEKVYTFDLEDKVESCAAPTPTV